jgi:hypothetical protein
MLCYLSVIRSYRAKKTETEKTRASTRKGDEYVTYCCTPYSHSHDDLPNVAFCLEPVAMALCVSKIFKSKGLLVGFGHIVTSFYVSSRTLLS